MSKINKFFSKFSFASNQNNSLLFAIFCLTFNNIFSNKKNFNLKMSKNNQNNINENNQNNIENLKINYEKFHSKSFFNFLNNNSKKLDSDNYLNNENEELNSFSILNQDNKIDKEDEYQNENEDENENDYEFSDNNNLNENENIKDVSALEQFGTNLTNLALNGKFSECFGREEELKQMMEILVRRQKNNPVLVGEAGVGKTAIIELFATRIVKNLVPFILEGRIIISIDLISILAGAQYRGEFELRFQKLLNEVLEQPNIIIFIDEIHNITGAGSAEGSLDAANILKPVLARNGFQCIGATTIKEYKQIENDPTLNRRFQAINVKEPSIEDTIDILYGIRPGLESFHNINISNSALKIAVELSHRYIYDRFLPDKAIDLLDRASAKIVIEMTSTNEKSIIISIVNSILRKISILRSEAFRKGDIASEFVFQEVENSYKNFLLNWLEYPININNLKVINNNMSPLSSELFNTMHLTIMKHADDLLFTPFKKFNASEESYNKSNLSIEKNNLIYLNFFKKKDLNLSYYRISLFLFKNWIKNGFLNLNTLTHKLNFYNYIYLNKNNESNFILNDIETKSNDKISNLDDLEEKRISIFKEYLRNLKPIVRRGLIESFNNSSSTLNLTSKEIKSIYNLLGYFTNEDDFLQFEKNDFINNDSLFNIKRELSQHDIRSVLSELTGIPLNIVSSSESEKLLNLENILHERVIGQEDAISVIAKAIRRSRMGIQNPNRPIASFLFCGPTGVGKTEVTKTLAENLFGSEKDLIRFDMSEFMEKFTISRLVGSPPGYIGYDDGGQLTDAVRSKPYSVVLFDEIEKAHPDILNILLQILDDGRLTDTKRRLVHFDNTVIILTSNAASSEIQNFIKNNNSNSNNFFSELELKNIKDKKFTYQDKYSEILEFLKSPIQETFLIDLKKKIKQELLFSLKHKNLPILFNSKNNFETIDLINNENIKSLVKKDENKKELKEIVLNKLSTLFLPEFLNRLDDIIIFEPLKQEELLKICNIMIKQLQNRMKTKNILLIVDENVKLRLTQKGYNPLFGARPLRRLITKYIEDLISEQLLISAMKINKNNREFHIILDINDEILLKEV